MISNNKDLRRGLIKFFFRGSRFTVRYIVSFGNELVKVTSGKKLLRVSEGRWDPGSVHILWDETQLIRGVTVRFLKTTGRFIRSDGKIGLWLWDRWDDKFPDKFLNRNISSLVPSFGSFEIVNRTVPCLFVVKCHSLWSSSGVLVIETSREGSDTASRLVQCT